MDATVEWKKNTCSLQNQCQTTNLIYQADVENEVNNEKKIYFKLAAKTFKECTTKTLSCWNIYGN